MNKLRTLLPMWLALIFVVTCLPVSASQLMPTPQRNTVKMFDNPVDAFIARFTGQIDENQWMLQFFGRTEWMEYRLTQADKKKLKDCYNECLSEKYNKYMVQEAIPALRRAYDYTPEAEQIIVQRMNEMLEGQIKKLNDAIDECVTFSDLSEAFHSLNF